MYKQISYVIIGNGIAGVTAAELLRAHDASCSLTIVAEESFPVYYRPALKDYLAERIPEEKLWARPSTFYQHHHIRFIPGKVTGIQAVQHYIQLQSGQQIAYHKLLLAHGAHPRPLTCPGAELAGVHTLRTVRDYQEIRHRLASARRIVVYGGGTLGLETAEALCHQGYEVTHLLRSGILWSEVLDETASDLVLQQEQRLGIDVRKGEEIVGVLGKYGQVTGVMTKRGEHIPCDMVFVALGIEPNIDFVRACGMSCGRGIRVDEKMRTNLPDMYAAGDVIEIMESMTGKTRVIGQWYPAIQQAQRAARSMLGLLDEQFTGMPYNATFLCGLDFVGLGTTVVPPYQISSLYELIADPAPRSYRKVLLGQGTPIGALLLGDRRLAPALKRAIDHHINLSAVRDRLFAQDFDLDRWLDTQHTPPSLLDLQLPGQIAPTLHRQNTSGTFSPREPQRSIVGSRHRTDLQIPTKGRVQFEIDMCIGCDRCMSACPLPLSSQVSIADLNQATLSTSASAHIDRFTYDCILCGSCVPVCPVDNHRDLLMVWLKKQLGTSWERKVDEERLWGMLPAGWSPAFLLSRLRKSQLLSDQRLIPDKYLFHLVTASRFLEIPAGQTVIYEGEYGRDLYLILSGQVLLSTTDSDDRILPLALLSESELFGEYGMLTGQPSTTTARAHAPSLLLQIPEQVLGHLMELVPDLNSFFDLLNTVHVLKAALKRLTLFEAISDEALQFLIDNMQIRHYERNVALFTEENNGRPARETLHVLIEGFVKVERLVENGKQGSRRKRVIAYRQAGDYFAGGLDLLGDSRAVTVTAINRVQVAEIPRAVILNIFQSHPEMEQYFAARLHEYIYSTASMHTGVFSRVALQQAITEKPEPSRKAGLHSIVDDGVVEGTEVLIIDLNRCIHCDECEQACARRHGQSRMNRKGRIVGNMSIVTACRQCHNPVCMLCSRAGIARHASGEVYITESCIGCGICAERCPYGAISIVDVEDEDTASSSWQRFSAFFTKKRRNVELPVMNGPLNPQPDDGYDLLRKKIAIKCDLCTGYADQACIQACPTGAALRVQPTTFFGSTEEILSGS